MTAKLTSALCVLLLSGAWAAPQRDSQKEDRCIIKFTQFLPGVKKDIEEKTSAESPIRKAADQVLSRDLKDGRVMVSARNDLKQGISEALAIEPNKGTVVIDGIKWNWQLKATLGPVIVSKKARPVVARFMVRLRLTVSTESLAPAVQLVQGDSSKDRWFYIVAGAGDEQDGQGERIKLHLDYRQPP